MWNNRNAKDNAQDRPGPPGEPYFRTIAMVCFSLVLLAISVVGQSTTGKSTVDQSTISKTSTAVQASSPKALKEHTADISEQREWERLVKKLMIDPLDATARQGLQNIFTQYVRLANEAGAEGNNTLKNDYLIRATNVLQGLHPARQTHR